MKPKPAFNLSITCAFVFLFPFTNGSGQTASSIPGLFESDEVLNITIKGSIRDLLNDRTGVPKIFPLTLSYFKEDSAEITMPVDMKTRGHFRRLKENCSYPPLMIEFPKTGTHLTTIFKEQKKLKLVMPCKGDEYVIREWLAYRLYNLISPLSFKARLVRVKLDDNVNRKMSAEFFGLLLEEEKQMAKRNDATAIEKKLLPQQTQIKEFLNMSVFQYMIGNTDWSIQYQQNIKLIESKTNNMPIAVPYDFDHSGIVNAPYAHPAEELLMSSIRERRYRGYCFTNLSVFEEVIKKFNDLKNEIYKTYANCKLIDAKYLKSTTQFLDDFFETINNKKTWQKDFAYPCDKNGTGNVVIKGLKED
jgi:hypothetical protein